jgi:tetratricopeptide (TPR) repeat protein
MSLGRFPRRDWDESDYSADRWAPAVQEFQDYVGKNPSSARALFNLGYALHFSGRHDEAVGAFEKAAELGFRTSTATYNVACANAMLNRTDAAMAALEIAVDSGNIHYGQLEGDDDLDNLRDDPRFQALLDRLEAEQKDEYADQMKMKMKKKMQMKADKAEYKVRRELHEHDDDD